jgi:hypothetical protein
LMHGVSASRKQREMKKVSKSCKDIKEPKRLAFWIAAKTGKNRSENAEKSPQMRLSK